MAEKFENVVSTTEQVYGFLTTTIKTDCSQITFSNSKCYQCYQIISVNLNRNALIEIRDAINIVLEQSKPTIKIN